MEENLWAKETTCCWLWSLWRQQTSQSEFKEHKETERRRRDHIHVWWLSSLQLPHLHPQCAPLRPTNTTTTDADTRMREDPRRKPGWSGLKIKITELQNIYKEQHWTIKIPPPPPPPLPIQCSLAYMHSLLPWYIKLDNQSLVLWWAWLNFKWIWEHI